jgi:hypothetical protein
MATVEECRAALERLSANLGSADADTRRKANLDRTLSAHITDLGVTFSGRLHDGVIDGITLDPAPKAQIRLQMTSDDLVALSDGSLDFVKAWTSGQVKLEASVLDLLKLRSMF